VEPHPDAAKAASLGMYWHQRRCACSAATTRLALSIVSMCTFDCCAASFWYCFLTYVFVCLVIMCVGILLLWFVWRSIAADSTNQRIDRLAQVTTSGFSCIYSTACAHIWCVM
jgi:hypothetical protein